MANTLEQSILLDSPQMAVIHYYMKSDGSTGDVTDGVVVDASALEGANAVSNIWRVQGCLVGFNARLEVDGSTDAEAIVMPDGQPFDYCFEKHNFPASKLLNLAAATGDITITTNGFTAATDEGFLIITVKKASS